MINLSGDDNEHLDGDDINAADANAADANAADANADAQGEEEQQNIHAAFMLTPPHRTRLSFHIQLYGSGHNLIRI